MWIGLLNIFLNLFGWKKWWDVSWYYKKNATTRWDAASHDFSLSSTFLNCPKSTTAKSYKSQIFIDFFGIPCQKISEIVDKNWWQNKVVRFLHLWSTVWSIGFIYLKMLVHISMAYFFELNSFQITLANSISFYRCWTFLKTTICS